MDNYTTEQWKPVVGYEGTYEVSDHGRVRSVDRVVATRNGHTRKYKSRMLSAAAGYAGYREVKLARSDKGKTRRVHDLVARAFIGAPRPRQIVCHIDSDPSNNNASNLRWDDHLGNSSDMVEVGRSTRGERAENHVLTEEMVRDARARWVPRKMTVKMLAAEYGVNHRTLGNAVRASGHSWKWLD